MAMTIDQKFVIARKLVERYQRAATACRTWWDETEQFRNSPRLMSRLTSEAKRELLGDWSEVRAEAQDAADKLPPDDLLTWEPPEELEP